MALASGSLKTRKRQGSSAVEFAITAPLVLLLLFGAIEMGRAVMVQHMLQETAQAGCRLYSVSDASQNDVTAIIAQAMNSAGIANYSVEYNPSNKADIDETMEPVTVSVSVDYEEISWLAPFYMNDAVVTARCTMPAEFIDDDGGATEKTKGKK